MIFFNWIDLICLTLLFIGGYFGFKKGFIYQIFRFAGIIAAMFLALHTYGTIARLMCKYCFLPLSAAKILSFLIIVITVIILARIAAVAVQKAVKVTIVKNLDKAGGLILGLLRYSIIISLVLMGLLFIPWSYLRISINDRSCVGKHLVKVAPAVYSGLIRVFPAYRDIGINTVLDQAMEGE